MLGDGLGLWRSMFFLAFGTYSFCVKKQFPFPLAKAELIGHYVYNRQCKANVVLSIYWHIKYSL
jgi:hypothetical protein